MTPTADDRSPSTDPPARPTLRAPSSGRPPADGAPATRSAAGQQPKTDSGGVLDSGKASVDGVTEPTRPQAQPTDEPVVPPPAPVAPGAETPTRSPAGSGPPSGPAPAPAPTQPLQPGISPIGRIPVIGVRPCVDEGRRPAKSVVDEEFVVSAQVFREGHDAVNATCVLTDPDGERTYLPMTCVNEGLSLWEVTIVADRPGWWSYRVEGWSDPWATWVHDGTIKIQADVDTDLMLEEGARVIDRRARTLPAQAPEQLRDLLEQTVVALRDRTRQPHERLGQATGAQLHRAFAAYPMRDKVSPSRDLPWLVERERALFGAWYEIFPRSEGAVRDPKTGQWTSGTFRTAMGRLPGIAAMGFDVVYLTPIHPIGTTARKGRNNTLTAEPGDPGSPYAIGSPDGGHDAIHPDLGTFADFDAFVAEAERLGLEVAMDIALQCSPDHPYVTAHPEWFTTRADGTIAYAENPPKKYQDIYPLNFDTDPEGAYAEMRRMIQVWIDHGVQIFRVDNPHTKPVEFWQWIIADVARDHPGVIWLSEAFTKPAMMHTLAKAGFQQSYTYYAWRNTKQELTDYCTELAGDAAAYMRPSFWPTTHDILTPYMQYGGPTAWKLRAALAATLVPTYGIYTGYELMEHVARPGVEEQIDNEKYEFKDRRWADYEAGGAKEGQGLGLWLGTLNHIRHSHPALRWLRNLRFHPTDDDQILCFSKTRVLPTGERDTIIVVANVDPHSTRTTWVHLDLPELGLDWGAWFQVHELITNQWWHWQEHNYVRLGPDTQPVHILEIRS